VCKRGTYSVVINHVYIVLNNSSVYAITYYISHEIKKHKENERIIKS
jgi:hypothetical protein